jgi:hypothetical protein
VNIRIGYADSEFLKHAYGMFLVHYPIVLWSQWLSDFDISAIGKGVVAFVLAVVSTWTATDALRKISGAARVLLLELAGTTYVTVIT